MDMETVTLPVPYVCQRDSTSDKGLRMCSSFTCAMAAEYLQPGCLAGSGRKLRYLLANRALRWMIWSGVPGHPHR